ncbi:MAG: hydroxyacylglutathione hydrolase [Gammaproteobacteria bacterium]
MLAITPLHAFRDNYIWALRNGDQAIVIDPGEAEPVERWLASEALHLEAILVTHHHHDHVGGVGALKRTHRVPVFGPAGGHIHGIDEALSESDCVTPAPDFPQFEVLEVPGHTLDHIAYSAPKLLFCGDTLFSAGCGRLFEGSAEQLHYSLSRLASLPATTRIYPAHEYTVANLRFGRAVLPEDVKLEKTLANALKIRENAQETLPTTVAREREINVFLRTSEPAVRAAAERYSGERLGSAVEVFAALRSWKDEF